MLVNQEARLIYLELNNHLPGGDGDINTDGSRCPDKTAHIKSFSFTLDSELSLRIDLEQSSDFLGRTYTTLLCSTHSESYIK